MLLDSSGKILVSVSELGYTKSNCAASTTSTANGIQYIGSDTWNTLKIIAELQDGGITDWSITDADENTQTFLISASKLDLPLVVNLIPNINIIFKHNLGHYICRSFLS